MRQLFNLVTIPTIMLLFLSCSKSSVTDIRGSAQAASTRSASPEKKIIGNWTVPASYYLNVDRMGNLSIIGEEYYNASNQLVYDKGSHVELVYARYPGRVAYQYKKLEYNMSNRVILKYSLGPDAFRLYFTNADYNSLVQSLTQVFSEEWEFRYIVISKTQYENAQVEWTDYLLVASALQFTP